MRKKLLSCILSAAISMAFAEQTTQDSQIKTDKTITPNAMPTIQHGFDIFLTADFIYWTARVDNLEYAHTGSTLTTQRGSNFVSITDQGGYQDVDHKMSPGFKAGLGFGLGHDGWDTSFQYTWLHSSATGRAVSNAQSLWEMSPGSNFNSTSSSVGSASSRWQLRFNNVDWELGREYFISGHLLLRPFVGLKGAWNKQTYSIRNDNIEFQASDGSGSTVLGFYHIYNTQHFWGVGVRVGLDSSWQFNRNWSIFGDWALSTLWSYFTVTRVDTAQDRSVSLGSSLTLTNEARKFHSVRPVLELDIGVRWDYWFLDDDYRIRIQAGWEQQVWFDQNQFINPVAPRYGSLTLQGLTLAFRLDF